MQRTACNVDALRLMLHEKGFRRREKFCVERFCHAQSAKAAILSITARAWTYDRQTNVSLTALLHHNDCSHRVEQLLCGGGGGLAAMSVATNGG